MESYCPYCMNPIQAPGLCPACGRDPASYRPASHHFPPGTLLHGRYVLGRALGEGGFGITYLGMDTELERRVAVKEYFPTAFVKRESSITLDVTCYTEAGLSHYQKGREQFLREARTMARLEKIPEIVRVLDFFQEHNTAYIVMEFLEGETLKDLTARLKRVPGGDLLEMLKPVMRAMETMHQAGVIHRDISPDNLMRMPDGTVKLMDFGCAKDIDGGRTMTVTLKHGFAPYEQYSGHGQGPWSDLYSLCATIYYCLTGRVPPDAMERDGEQDPLLPPAGLGADLTPRQERALLKGLAVRAEDRWQSMGELHGALYGVNLDGTPWQEPVEEEKAEYTGKTEYAGVDGGPEPDGGGKGGDTPSAPGKKRLSKGLAVLIAACCVLVIAVGAARGGGLFKFGDAGQTQTGPENSGGTAALPGEPSGDGETGAPEEDGEPALELLPGLSEDPQPSGSMPSDGGQEPQPQDDSNTQGTQTAANGEQQGGKTPGQSEKPRQDPSPSSQTTPEPKPQPDPEPTQPPTPTKEELEAKAKAAQDSGQYAQAAAVYQEMNGYGYVSNSKLGSVCYELGLDAEGGGDYQTAYELYTKSANLGNAPGMYCLGCLYDNGLHVTQDQAKAVQWWEKAGAIEADYYYWPGLYYARGRGVAQDISKAIGYLEKCVARGGLNSMDAQALLDELQGG